MTGGDGGTPTMIIAGVGNKMRTSAILMAVGRNSVGIAIEYPSCWSGPLFSSRKTGRGSGKPVTVRTHDSTHRQHDELDLCRYSFGV
jgi:hypothetical protein